MNGGGAEGELPGGAGGKSLQEECSLDVVQTVHETLCGMIEEQQGGQDSRAADAFRARR